MAAAVRSEWPSAAQLDENALMVRSESTAELARLEAKFGFSSEELPNRLATGEIEQTAEVCHWLLVIEVLAGVTRGQPA